MTMRGVTWFSMLIAPANWWISMGCVCGRGVYVC